MVLMKNHINVKEGIYKKTTRSIHPGALIDTNKLPLKENVHNNSNTLLSLERQKYSNRAVNLTLIKQSQCLWYNIMQVKPWINGYQWLLES